MYINYTWNWLKNRINLKILSELTRDKRHILVHLESDSDRMFVSHEAEIGGYDWSKSIEEGQSGQRVDDAFLQHCQLDNPFQFHALLVQAEQETGSNQVVEEHTRCEDIKEPMPQHFEQHLQQGRNHGESWDPSGDIYDN